MIGPGSIESGRTHITAQRVKQAAMRRHAEQPRAVARRRARLTRSHRVETLKLRPPLKRPDNGSASPSTLGMQARVVRLGGFALIGALGFGTQGDGLIPAVALEACPEYGEGPRLVTIPPRGVPPSEIVSSGLP